MHLYRLMCGPILDYRLDRSLRHENLQFASLLLLASLQRAYGPFPDSVFLGSAALCPRRLYGW